jgi:beta-lactamase class A
MEENKITGALLRKHLPSGWRIADRSGAGENGSRGFAAMIWPPEGLPFTVVIYMTNTTASFKERNEEIAGIGRVLVNSLKHFKLDE